MGRQGRRVRKAGLTVPTRCARTRVSEQRCGQAVGDRLNAVAPCGAVRGVLVKLLGDDVNADRRRDAGVEMDFYLVLSDLADSALGQTHFRA